LHSVLSSEVNLPEAPLFQVVLISLDELKASYAESPAAFRIRFKDKFEAVV